jgi:hypothetical protein
MFRMAFITGTARQALCLLSAAAAVLAVAAPASANVVEFRNLVGTWSNGQTIDPAHPTIPLTVTGNGTANSQAAWGTALSTSGQSAYGLNALPLVSVTVPDEPGVINPFTIGSFFHRNAPISGIPLRSIDLTIQTDLFVNNAQVLGARTFNFHFVHNETPNAGTTCPYGGANLQGVNINGCADVVHAVTDPDGDTFLVGNDYYTVTMAGFLLGNTFTTDFLSSERYFNSVPLQGRLNYVGSLAPDPEGGLNIPAVPEPAAWALMILGFGGIGGLMRRRRIALLA